MLSWTILSLGLLLDASSAFAAGTEVEPPADVASAIEVVFETTVGEIAIELDPVRSPKTVANFLTYLDQGFYSNTLFHRVIPGFVVQGGGYEPGMKKKETHFPVENESSNGWKNTRGTVSMARSRDPDSGTSQFFINVAYNASLDDRPNRPGYAVFARVTRGMDVVDAIVAMPVTTRGQFKDVPEQNVILVSATRITAAAGVTGTVHSEVSQGGAADRFIAGEDYVVLEKPVPKRDRGKIEVVEAFSYGCGNCLGLEPLISDWRSQQSDDVDFWQFHAVWNRAMELYARAFYAAKELGAARKIHLPLFNAIVVEHRQLQDVRALAEFVAMHGVDAGAFTKAFDSAGVSSQVRNAKARSRGYNLASVPEFVVNGKYRVDPMRAGGRLQMLQVVEFLVEKERGSTSR